MLLVIVKNEANYLKDKIPFQLVPLSFDKYFVFHDTLKTITFTLTFVFITKTTPLFL